MKWLGREIHHSLSGKDGRLSIRRVLAVFFSLGFMQYINKCSDVTDAIIWAFVVLISGLLTLTTGQNIGETFSNKFKKEKDEEDPTN
jgi:hypothetical protein